MTKKILLVEDTIEALYNLRDLLRLEGFEIITATNGTDALLKLYSYTPDLIITDLRMPQMDGFELIEKVKKTAMLQSIPIIVFSANGSKENETRSILLGAHSFLKKPSSIEAILRSIHAVLGLEV
jgi:CheY-like chemotaxis protein